MRSVRLMLLGIFLLVAQNCIPWNLLTTSLGLVQLGFYASCILVGISVILFVVGFVISFYDDKK